MDIYIVKQGDSINSIAESYGVAVERLARDNGLEEPYNLVIGQAIVIAFPKQSHTVQQGDTLQSIADTYGVTPVQILRNNPHISDREFLYPGEILVISYNTRRSITTNGYAYPYIRRETLLRTLPSLTYLSIFNYTATGSGEIITYQEDAEIIRTTKAYGVVPLLMLATMTPQGVYDTEAAYKILLNEEYQDRNINEFLNIMKNKGYQGVNLVFYYLEEGNQSLYQRFVQKVASRLQAEGFLFFVTINYSVQRINNTASFEHVDYSELGAYLDGMIFLRFVWGTDYGPPAPVSDISDIRIIIDYVISDVPANKICIGKQLLGYDWQLPYTPGRSSAVSLTLRSVLELAYEVGAAIQFDEVSQTPYFYYNQSVLGDSYQHIVWFIDPRSLYAMNEFIIEYGLKGSGIWNIMIYHQQLWTVINAEFDVVKLI
jgi:spore germination protein